MERPKKKFFKDSLSIYVKFYVHYGHPRHPAFNNSQLKSSFDAEDLQFKAEPKDVDTKQACNHHLLVMLATS